MKRYRVTRCALVALILAILPSVRAQSNAVLREVFRDIGGGTSVVDLTSSAKFIANMPDERSLLTSLFEAPTDVLDNYGQRLGALITAPATGQYTFWIASDDASDLYLSTDANPANKTRIAFVAAWTASREWTKEANQRSAPLFLIAGQRYYIEALMKEGIGGDNLAVRWERADGVDEAPINLTNCVPYSIGAPFITVQPASLSVVAGGPAAFSVSAIGGSPLSYQWRKNGTPIPGAVNPTFTFSNVFLGDSGGYSCSIGNALGSVISQVASLTVLSDVTQPGDPIVPSSFNSPGSEGAGNIIDNQPTKYLNFDAVNTGFTVTPSSGSSVIQALSLTSANDAPERDPASYRLEGSNNGSNFVVIASNGVPVFSARFEKVVISFANNTPFSIYRLIFPITVGPSPCCMQIAEVELLAAVGPPTITSQPSSRTVTNGNNATFSVTAIGTPPLSYQWYFNGANLSGRTNASLTIVNAGPTNAGNYTVVVANSAGSITSAVATLTVLVANTFIQSAPITINDNAAATPYPSTIFVSGVVGMVSKVTVTLSNISHTFPSDLDVLLVGPNGQSVMLMSSSGGGSAITNAVLTFDDTAAQAISTGTQITNGTFRPADLGSATLPPPAPGPPGGVRPYNTNLSVFNGFNPNGTWQLFVNDHALADVGSMGSWRLDLAAGMLVPPSISAQPQSLTVTNGSNAVFDVSATGTAPLAYQWRFNGSNLGGQTNSTLTIFSAAPANEGNYTVVIGNSAGSITSAVATLTVLAPPTISAPTNLFTVIEGTLLTFTNTASDANSGQVLTFALAAGAPTGTAVNATNGVFTWTPTEAQGPSSNNISIVVSDNGTPSLSATQVVAILVLEANSAPVLTAIGDRSATEGVPLAFTATASDPDVPANGLTFTLGSGAPAGASITAGGNFTWTPSEAQGPGVYGVTFIVSDNGVPMLIDSETIQITVSEVNTPPLVSVPTNSVSVSEGNLLSFSASGSDNDLPPQTLTFSLAAGAPAGAAITAGGAFTWTPTEAQGPSSNNISIVVSDNGTPSLSATQVVAILVLEANSAPVLTAIGDRSATEGVPLAFTATASDPDVPANGLTFTLGSGAPAGASITAGGNFTWTPSEAQGPGVYGVTFIVSDNGVPMLIDSETIQITVSEVNTPPLVSVPTNSVSVSEGNLLSFSASGSDNDLPPQTLTFSLAAGAPAGAAITAGGAFTWTPTEAQGPSSNNISIVVSDNGTPSLSATQVVAILVLEANSAPVLTAIGDRSATEGVPLAFTATASDPDVPANGLTFTLGSGAPAGASITAGGNFTWTPSEAQGPGVYGVTFIVSDNGVPMLIDSETIQITVSEVNTPPLVSVPTNSVSVSEGNLLSFSASGSDNDLPPQTLTFSLAAGAPAGAAITAGGAFTWTPTEAQGPFTNVVGIVVTDNGAPNLTATQLVTLAVLEANSAPVLTAIGNKSVLQGQTLSFTLSATDADVPANVLTYSMSGAPGGAMLNTDTGAFSWVATNTGTFSVTFGVQDNGVPIRTDSEAIQIVVTATNTAPLVSAQPASLTVTNGGSAVFSVSATGTAPLAYQWRFNGGNLAGETSASLTINSAAPANAGGYTVLIANTAGSITSAVATLTVVPQTAVLESYSLDLPAGYSLIANQLHQGNNLISAILPNVSNGTTLRKWNGVSQTFTVETYVGGRWQPGTTTLAPGEGAFIFLPTPRTLVFAGEFRPPTLPLNLFPGLNLVSRQVPLPGSFEQITGRSPEEGVIVDQYRPATDDYRTQVFLDGQWRDGVPAARVGEAVWVSQFTQPVITGQPAPQTNATPGSTINFTVAVTGTPPLRYQWQRNGVSIPDATDASYTIPNAQIVDSGTYTVAVQPSRIAPPTAQAGRLEDLPGTVGSAPAALRFNTIDFPFSDDFGARPVVNTNAATLTGNNSAASLEPGEPLHAGKPGGHSVWLAWMAPANGIITFITLGSSFDTLLAAYSGSGFPGAEMASDDDGGPFLSSRITFNATAGQIYNIAVDGFGDGTGDFVLSWNLEVTAEQVPIILTQPQNQLASFNGAAQFTVEASGINLTYQWFRDGQVVSGATSSNLVISPVQETDVGVYIVQINSGSRFVLSHPALLQINAAGDNVLFAQDKFEDVVIAANNTLAGLAGKAARKVVAHGFSGTQILSSIGSVKQENEPNHCGLRGGKSQWFPYQPTNNGTLKVDTDGSNFDTVLAVYVGPGDDFLTLTNVTCDNDSGTNGITSSVLFNVTSNTIYYIAIDGVNDPITGVAASGRIQINYRLVLPLTLTSLNYTSNANGRVIFKVSGTPTVPAIVQSASSLAAPTWTSLFTNTSASGTFTYTNTNALTLPNRFYRVIHQF